MFGVSPAIMSLLAKLGEYGQNAIEKALADKMNGVQTDPDVLADWLHASMVDWHPTLKGRPLADPATRKAAARFLAGIACNLTKTP
jgi:hypothetical protein